MKFTSSEPVGVRKRVASRCIQVLALLLPNEDYDKSLLDSVLPRLQKFLDAAVGLVGAAPSSGADKAAWNE